MENLVILNYHFKIMINTIKTYILYSKQELDRLENINLLIQNLKGYQIDLNQYVKITENQVNENGKLIKKYTAKGL